MSPRSYAHGGGATAHCAVLIVEGMTSDRTVDPAFPFSDGRRSCGRRNLLQDLTQFRARGLISDRRKFSTCTTMETGDFRIAAD